jgi:rare lipoprotein A (peptidoglycan hydrolase)
MSHRIPTLGRLLLACTCAGITLPAVAGADNGGTPAPTPGGAGTVDPSFVLVAPGSLYLGGSLQVSGAAPDAANQTVVLQTRDASGLWQSVATTTGDAHGNFSANWHPLLSGQYELRAAISGAQASDSATASVSRQVLVYEPARASWYGPGFYGKRTACGKKLNRATTGVANRHLPCGTQIAVAYKGKSVVVSVIDRGPFAHGVQWDLTSATAKKLGVTVTSRVGVAPITLPLAPPQL